MPPVPRWRGAAVPNCRKLLCCVTVRSGRRVRQQSLTVAAGTRLHLVTRGWLAIPSRIQSWCPHGHWQHRPHRPCSSPHPEGNASLGCYALVYRLDTPSRSSSFPALCLSPVCAPNRRQGLVHEVKHTSCWDAYEVIREIGHGMTGKVYQVKHKLTGEIYALKCE